MSLKQGTGGIGAHLRRDNALEIPFDVDIVDYKQPAAIVYKSQRAFKLLWFLLLPVESDADCHIGYFENR